MGWVWTLPNAWASSFGRWTYWWRSVARFFARSSDKVSPRDCGSTWGSSALSNSVTTLPSPTCRASCCQANLRSRPHREVALLAAEPPDHLAGRAVDLVDRPGVAGRDEQVAVGVDVDRVDVEEVERGSDLRVGLGELDVVEAPPLEEHAGARYRELLHDPLDHAAAAGSDARAVDGRDVVGRDERSPLGRQDQLVQVGAEPVARREPRDLPVGVIGDHVVPDPEAVLGPALPPGECRLAEIGRRPEVEHARRNGRTEPDELAGVVDDHRPALAGARRRAEEEQARRRSRAPANDGDLRRDQVGP